MSVCINAIRKDLNYRIIKDIFSQDESFVDFDNLFKKTNINALLGNKINSSYDYLFSIDLSKLFIGTKLDTYFDCFFFKGNIAWISENDNHFRYFTRSFNKKMYSFDIIDIAKPYFNIENDFEIVNFLLDKFNLVDLSSYWRKTQTNKYNRNIELLGCLTKIRKTYPYLYKTISKHKDILIYLNRFGIRNLLNQDISYEKNALFFISSAYLEAELGVSRSKISKLLNLFCLIGILTKVPVDKIPKSMYDKSLAYSKKHNKKNIINYYTVIDIRENIEILEDDSREVFDSGIRYSNITRANIEKLLKSSYLNRIV